MPLAILILTAAAAQAVVPPMPPTAPAATATAPTTAVTGSVPLRRDRKGRPVIGVEVNGRGPFDMVVDTGAQASVVTPALAAELSLPRLSSTVAVQGATGVNETSLYGVDRLSSGLFDLRNSAMAALPNANLTEARGIVGMDVANARKLTFDLRAGTLRTAPSGPPAAGFIAISGRLRNDGLLVVPITIDGRAVEALVDSGAEGVIAGPGLIELLGWRSDDPRLKPYGTMRGAGGASQSVRFAKMGPIGIGPVTFSDVPVVITPAIRDDGGKTQIILGSSLLGLLSAYAVDLQRAALEVRVPS